MYWLKAILLVEKGTMIASIGFESKQVSLLSLSICVLFCALGNHPVLVESPSTSPRQISRSLALVLLSRRPFRPLLVVSYNLSMLASSART